MTSSDLLFDRVEIVRALNVYHQPGDIVELRIPKAGRAKTISGYFDDFGILADNVVGLSDDRDVNEAGGVYITLNQIDPRLLSRSTNRYKRYTETTTADGDVVRLNWLPVDFDPVRPAGIPSSDEEHKAALDKAREVRDWLISRGWPVGAFVVGDSGNGGHLPVKIDLEPSGENVKLVERCLKALDFVFSDEVVKVDLTTYNPARIWKLPGTVTRKGDTSEDRPHRLARLLVVPEVLEVVPRELLGDLAAILPEDEPVRYGQRGGDDFDPVRYAEEYGLKVSKVKPWNGGVLAELEVCPFNSDHKRTARIGRLPSGARYFGCFHDGCRGNDWHTLRDLLEPDRDRQERAAPKAETTEEGKGETVGFHLGDFGEWTTVTKMFLNEETGKKEPKNVQKFEFSRDKAAGSFSEKMALAMEFIGGDIHFFNGQIYRPEGAVKITNELYSIAKDHVNRFTVSEILDRLKAEYGLKLVKFDPNPYLLGVKNGVVDLRTGEFREYRPEDLITYQIDVTYDPAARCPKYLKFLEEIQPNVTDRLTLVDWFPATAIRLPLPYVLFLLGLGRNGKGIYERLIKRFFGATAFRDMALAEVSKNNFAAGTFYKKLGWIATEQSGKKKATIGTDFIKLVSGAGTIDSDVKNRARIQFEAYFQAIVDTNAMPQIEDNSIGWMERFCKQDLPYVFVNNPDPKNPLEKKKDPHLLSKLTTDEELSGILNLLIWRAKAICETETITKRPAGELFNEYTKQSSSLSTFWEEFCDHYPGVTESPTSTATIYSAYKRWCSHLVGEVVNEKWFGAYLKKQCGGIDPGRKTVKDEDGGSKKVRFYPGLHFDEEKLNKAIEGIDSNRTKGDHKGPSKDHQFISKTNNSKDNGPSGPSNLWIDIIDRFGDSPQKSSLYGRNPKNDGFDGPDGPLDSRRPDLEKSDGPLMVHHGPSDGPNEAEGEEVDGDVGDSEPYQTIAENLEEGAKREAEYLEKSRTPTAERSDPKNDPPDEKDNGRIFGLTHSYYLDLGGGKLPDPAVLAKDQGWPKDKAVMALGMLRAAGVVR